MAEPMDTEVEKKQLCGLGDVQSAIKKLRLESDGNKSLAVLLESKAKQEVVDKLEESEIKSAFLQVALAKGGVGVTALHVASFVGNELVCQWLIEHLGIAVHAVDEFGQTPLHYAAANGQADSVKRLRLHHADVYFKNKSGSSPLDVVSTDDCKEVLLGSRFPNEEIEDEFLQDKLPQLSDAIIQAGKNQSYNSLLELACCLRAEIRSATSSLTSVPKPLKFLSDVTEDLIKVFDEMKDYNPELVEQRVGTTLANIISVLAMAKKDGDPEKSCLKFCLISRRPLLKMATKERVSQDLVSSFGDPYIRHLCMQFTSVYQELDPGSSDYKRDHQLLMELRDELAKYLIKHNAEAEACDLLVEIEDTREVGEEVHKKADNETLSQIMHRLIRDAIPVKSQTSVIERMCKYLLSSVKYVQEPMNSHLLETALDLYMAYQCYPQALVVAMQLNNVDIVWKVLRTCDDNVIRKQLCFMLGQQQLFLNLDDEEDMEDVEELKEIISNVSLNSHFLNLGRELDIVEPKDPEHIYKTHLENVRFSSVGNVDSAKQNLASSFVNGFVNCAFGRDNTMTEDGNSWIYKNKASGMLSATASLGLILLWDVDAGLTEIDKYLYSGEDNVKAGALLACGIVNSGVRNECDPAQALLSEYVLHSSSAVRVGAVMGLGLAYAGSCRMEIVECLLPVLQDSKSTPEIVGLTALSCGLIFIGSCDDNLTDTFLQMMLEKSDDELSNTYMRFVALGISLLYLGKQEKAEVPLAALQAVGNPLGVIARTLLEICAYTGTGDVLKVQSLLHICSEHFGEKPEETSKEEEKDKKEQPQVDPGSLNEPGAQQAFAVLGLALISVGEDIGSEMALRTYSHLLHYGEPVIRRAVPLALGLLSVSHPDLSIMDTLSKFSHDSDPEVAYTAIFAMGLIGAGTNNARLAGLLRQLAQFYCKDQNSLYMVRIAQGLVHLGKGTLTLNPFHSDRLLMSSVAIGGLLAVILSCLDCKNLVLSSSPHLLYFIVPAIQPRMLVTFDENLKPLTVNVRVGQAVDTVASAGQQKSITGFQTHTTPVLLAYGERAELATNEYIPLTPILEGFVILRKNPDYEES